MFEVGMLRLGTCLGHPGWPVKLLQRVASYLAGDNESKVARPPLWPWTSHLCWKATASCATGRDDDHVAQEYQDAAGLGEGGDWPLGA